LTLDALVAGERDPVVLAGLARGVLRNKTEDLRLALAGRFTDHHGQMVALHLARIDHLDQMLTQVKEKIGRVGKDRMPGLVDPFAAQIELLMGIPGVGERVAGRGHLRDRDRHGQVPHRQAPGRVGRAGPGQQRIGR